MILDVLGCAASGKGARCKKRTIIIKDHGTKDERPKRYGKDEMEADSCKREASHKVVEVSSGEETERDRREVGGGASRSCAKGREV